MDSEFLRADQLPDTAARRWTREYIQQVHIEEPLPSTCATALGTETNQNDVQDARYPSTDGRDSAEQQVHTYTSASYAASRMTAYDPKCGGVTARTATGFAWRGAGPEGPEHVLFVRVDNKVDTLVITANEHDYDAALDAGVLQTMAQRLTSS